VADADLLIRGGTVVRDTAEPGDVAVADGAVVAVGAGLKLTGRHEIDARGLHVLPGGVDPHVHFDEPGRAEWEGFATGSAALAAGGFTTFVDMPLNSAPPTVDADAFERKVAAARGSAVVDFALWAGLVPGNLHQLAGLMARGALGFKAFMCESGIADFQPVDDVTLWEGMRRCAELDAIVLVHAENDTIVRELRRRAVAAGRTGARDFLASRPVAAELEAISRALFFAGETGCAVHIVHVSTPRGVELVERARADGVDASCETCPHYLLLTEADVPELGTVAKCAPPLRTAEDREGLWDLLRIEAVPFVASDHSPCPPDLRRGDFFQAWGGIAGCQTTLQLLLAEGYARRGVPLPDVVALTSTNAARRFRLAGKGAIEPGADADLVLIDLSVEWELSDDELLYRHRVTPFAGLPVRGRVARTLLRGETVFEAGRVASAPAGRLVRPSGHARM
jgi:allantoinase